MISIWKCSKKPTLLKRKSLRKPQSQNNQRSLQSVIYFSHLLQYKHICHTHTILFSTWLTHTTAALYTELSFQWTGWALGALFITFMKRMGWFPDTSLFYCTAMELLGCDSQKTTVKLTTNLIIIFTSTLRHNAGVSYRPSNTKWAQSMNITFTPARIPHRHNQRLWKSLLWFMY